MNTLTKALIATAVTGLTAVSVALPANAAELGSATTSTATSASAADRLEGMVELSRISTSTLYGFLPAPSASDANLRLVTWQTAGTWTTPAAGDTGEISAEGLCLTASPVSEAAAVAAEECDGSTQQQWAISADGHLTSAEWGGSTFKSSLGRTYLRPATTPQMKLELGLLSPVSAH